MFSSRLSDDVVKIIDARAAQKGESRAEALAALVMDANDMRGRDGMEQRIAVMQATIDEQERLLEGRGQRTPRTKRYSVGLTLVEAAEIDAAARAAGMTRSEYMRSRLLGGAGARRALPATTTTIRPAPAGALPATPPAGGALPASDGDGGAGSAPEPAASDA